MEMIIQARLNRISTVQNFDPGRVKRNTEDGYAKLKSRQKEHTIPEY
jgi:hypothetical protein